MRHSLLDVPHTNPKGVSAGSRSRSPCWAVRSGRPIVSGHVATWTDPRCGGRLVTTDLLVGELVGLLLAGDDIECLRAYGGGCEVVSGTEATGGLEICLVGINSRGALIYMAVDDRVGTRSHPDPARSRLRRKCRGLGGTLKVWTAERIARASHAMQVRSPANVRRS